MNGCAEVAPMWRSQPPRVLGATKVIHRELRRAQALCNATKYE